MVAWFLARYVDAPLFWYVFSSTLVNPSTDAERSHLEYWGAVRRQNSTSGIPFDMRIHHRDLNRIKALPDEQLRDWIAGQNPLSGFYRAAKGEMERRKQRHLLVLWGVSAALLVGFLISIYL